MRNLFFIFIIIFVFLNFSCNNNEESCLIETVKPEAFLLNNNLLDYNIKDISVDDACKVAKLFRQKSTLTKSNHSTEVKDIIPVTDVSGDVLMYIINFENNSGFIIISATKDYMPILAYSDEGYFDYSDPKEIPIGLEGWISENIEDIHSYKLLSQDSVNPYRQMWSSYEDLSIVTESTKALNDDIRALAREAMQQWSNEGYQALPLRRAGDGYFISLDLYDMYCVTASNQCYYLYDNSYLDNTYVLKKDNLTNEEVGPLLTTKWGQMNNFNDLVPNQYPAGCVAISMAQIMNYHKYPTRYDWSSMHNVTATQAAKELIRDAGRSVNTDYGSDGSGAHNDNIPSAMRNTFGYMNGGTYVSGSYIADQANIDLRNRRPFIMGGFRDKFLFVPYNGHTWVCDGFRSSEIAAETTIAYLRGNPYRFIKHPSGSDYSKETTLFYHYNWGNHGSYNGWFLYQNFKMTEGKDYKYGRNNVFNIKP